MTSKIPSNEDLVGAWRLMSAHHHRSSSSERWHLLGQAPDGLLIYDLGGWMSVSIYSTPGEDLESGALGYIGYFGTYEVLPEEKVVLHHAIRATLPRDNGVTHRRFFELDGDVLTLTTPELQGYLDDPKERVKGTLVWKRVTTSDPK